MLSENCTIELKNGINIGWCMGVPTVTKQWLLTKSFEICCSSGTMDSVPLLFFSDWMFLGPWMMEQREGEWKELKSTGKEGMRRSSGEWTMTIISDSNRCESNQRYSKQGPRSACNNNLQVKPRFRFSFSPECSTSKITHRLSITYRLVDDACPLTSVDILKDQLLLESKRL
jgi:ribosomal protein L32